MMNSRYTYPNNNEVLINKDDIQDYKRLDDFETYHTTNRLKELFQNKKLMKRTFDGTHLKNIHHYLFQDVYYDRKEMSELDFDGKLPLRGEYRLEEIHKTTDGHTTRFARVLFFENGLDYLFNELKNERFNGLSTEDFISRLAYYIGELNFLHPFREGNGRTIREFIRQLAENHGYVCDWSLLEQEEKQSAYMNAMIKSVNQQYAELKAVLAGIVKKAN